MRELAELTGRTQTAIRRALNEASVPRRGRGAPSSHDRRVRCSVESLRLRLRLDLSRTRRNTAPSTPKPMKAMATIEKGLPRAAPPADVQIPSTPKMRSSHAPRRSVTSSP
ncbi:hypothetical protein [Lapillicoccus jejuensis]|uniref:hypothetical protein n=1 Tax=Lapillicoccus jejuensis TaxID=402171 RepID=UPI003CCC8AF8